MPQFLFSLECLLVVLLFLATFAYFRRSSEGRKVVRTLTGSDTPDEVVEDLKDAKQRALAALPEAEQELAIAENRVHELRQAAGFEDEEDLAGS